MAKALIVTSLTFAALLLCGGQSAAQTTPEAFDQLKKLEGEWTGTLRLTPGEHLERLGLSAEQSLTLNYSVRSGGTSLLEESSSDGIEMVTVYNAQGNSLLSTHYCVLANRPVGTLDASVNGVLSCSELIRWKITSNIGVFLRFLTSLLTTGMTFAVILSPGRCLLT
mgnify:CR=1 FL=1